jgi:hypothetical protein
MNLLHLGSSFNYSRYIATASIMCPKETLHSKEEGASWNHGGKDIAALGGGPVEADIGVACALTFCWQRRRLARGCSTMFEPRPGGDRMLATSGRRPTSSGREITARSDWASSRKPPNRRTSWTRACRTSTASDHDPLQIPTIPRIDWRRRPWRGRKRSHPTPRNGRPVVAGGGLDECGWVEVDKETVVAGGSGWVEDGKEAVGAGGG